MKRRSLLFILFLSGALFACQSRPLDTVSQVSTIDAILAGVYDGQLPASDLLSYGDFGIGTLDGLDGEMIILDGELYQVRTDGKVYRPSLATKTPFASMATFRADGSLALADGMNFEQLQSRIDQGLTNPNIFYAIKVKGTFANMKVRSVPAQQKPYPPLVEVAKQQAVFDLKDVSGTLVGFRSPAYAKGINVPGYHLHFITDDKSAGGHVLDFQVADATAEYDACNRFFMLLPMDNAGFGGADLSKDRSQELHKAER